MNVCYKDDAEKGPGNGLLILSEALFPEGPWQISIQRASDQHFITGKKTKPWVGEKFFLPLEGVAGADGSLTFPLGPAIVDELDQLDGYRVSLKSGDDTLRGNLHINKITYSPADSLGNMAQAPDEKTNLAAPEKPAQAPAAERSVTGAPIAPDESMRAARAEADKPLEMPAPQQHSRRLLRLGILCLLIAICIGWYLVDKYRTREEKPSGPAVIEEPAPQKPAHQAQSGTTAKGPEASVREFFKQPGHTPEQAMSLAAKLPDSAPADQDAIYRLYYYAATSNYGPALMHYGACLDPAKPAWGSIEKDGAAAWNVYGEARKQNIPEAAEAMASLEKWLEKESAAGNADAAAWLRQIKS